MPRKNAVRKSQARDPIVSFSFDNRTYQIDPERRKVYRSFVELETSKAFEIWSLWRSTNLRA